MDNSDITPSRSPHGADDPSGATTSGATTSGATTSGASPGDGPGPVVPAATDADEILDVVLSLVGTERAGPPAMWILLLDARGMMLPFVLPLVGVPLRPDPAQVQQVMVALGDVLAHDAPGGSIAVALVRAAGGDRGSFERAWEHALRTAAADRGVHVRAVVAVGEHRARVLPT